MISAEPVCPVRMKSPFKSVCRCRACSKEERPAVCSDTSPSMKMNEASPGSSAAAPPVARRA
jgi:hypothetical protein